MYHQLKYETFHDLHELEQESTDNLFFSGFSSDLNNPQNPPSYVSVVEQPQSRQREVDSSSTAQPQSSYVQHVPEHTHRIREIPLTCQPQGTINTTAVTRQPAKRPWRTEVCDCCASWSVCKWSVPKWSVRKVLKVTEFFLFLKVTENLVAVAVSIVLLNFSDVMSKLGN